MTEPLTGYGGALYGRTLYQSSGFRSNTMVRIGIRVRIIKPPVESPPLIDTVVRGLARYFNFLQQGVQNFALFNKIQYATGEADGFRLSLDEVWGRIYDLPRLTGESDDDYRARLMTYVKVLTGSGTVPACEEVLDTLIGMPGGSTITSRWPAQAEITFGNIAAMRAAQARQTLLNSVLPGMFAAGVDYSMIIPLASPKICAYIGGDAEMAPGISAAIATERETNPGISALVAHSYSLTDYIRAAISVQRSMSLPIRATIRGEPDLHPWIAATIRGEPDLYPWIAATIQGEPSLMPGISAAIARTFKIRAGILARIEHLYAVQPKVITAIRADRSISPGIRVRIAKRL